MIKFIAILMSALLVADDLSLMEEDIVSPEEISVEGEVLTENIIEQLYQSDEPIEQVVSYLKGNYIILDTGLVLAPKDAGYIEIFDEEDDVLVLKISDGYVVVHSLTQVEVMCEEVGRVAENKLSIAKVFTDMIELSNGDLYSLQSLEESFWEAGADVFVVKTNSEDMIIDCAFGFSENVVSYGNLDKTRILDLVVNVKGHHLNLVSTGPLRSISEDLGSVENWVAGDEVILQRFNLVTIKNFDSFTPFILAHNVTKNEVAIVVLLTH